VEEFIAQLAPIGFADESCMEVRLMVINTRKCRNEGIVRYERTEMEYSETWYTGIFRYCLTF
jgi:hypothetical protein